MINECLIRQKCEYLSLERIKEQMVYILENAGNPSKFGGMSVQKKHALELCKILTKIYQEKAGIEQKVSDRRQKIEDLVDTLVSSL